MPLLKMFTKNMTCWKIKVQNNIAELRGKYWYRHANVAEEPEITISERSEQVHKNMAQITQELMALDHLEHSVFVISQKIISKPYRECYSQRIMFKYCIINQQH